MITFSDHDQYFTLEAITQAAIIFTMAIAIILANVLIIATFVNARGKVNDMFFFQLLHLRNVFF